MLYWWRFDTYLTSLYVSGLWVLFFVFVVNPSAMIFRGFRIVRWIAYISLGKECSEDGFLKNNYLYACLRTIK